MKHLYGILLLIFLASCSGKNEKTSLFFENCTCTPIDFEDGFVYSDSLNQFSVRIPDSTWRPARMLENDRSIIILGDSAGNGVSIITSSLSSLDSKWDHTAQEAYFLANNEVISKGKSDNFYWYVVYEGPEAPQTVHAFSLDEEKKKLFSTTFRTSDTQDPKKSICTLEGFLKTIE